MKKGSCEMMFVNSRKVVDAIPNELYHPYAYYTSKVSMHIYSSHQKGSRGSKVQKAVIGKGLHTATFFPIKPQGLRNAKLFLSKPLNQVHRRFPICQCKK